jgi:hypothetical protein
MNGEALLILVGCAVFLLLVCAVALLVVCSRLGALQSAVKKLGGSGLPALYEPDIRVEPLYAPSAPAPAAAVPTVQTRLLPGGDVTLADVDDRTAAVLMAIVADELQLPLEQLRFVSIREVK